MTYWNEKAATTVNRGARESRSFLPIAVSEATLTAIDKACCDTPGCQSRMDFISGAVFHFESLTREEQINQIIATNTTKEYRQVSVRLCVAEKVRAWNFPAFSISRVVSTVACAFANQPSDQRARMVAAAIRFVCETSEQ